MSESTTNQAQLEELAVRAQNLPTGPSESYSPTPMSKTEAGIWLAVGTGLITILGFAIRADIKNQEKYAEQLRLEREERDAKAEASRKARTAWFDKQRTNGMRVLELRDGSYIAISNEAYSQAEIKKKGQWL